MATKCNGCGKPILDLQYMECNICKELYHVPCLGMKKGVFEQLSPDYIEQWLCPPCVSSKPKTGNLQTPLRGSPGMPLNNTYTSSPCPLEVNKSYYFENVTVRGGLRGGQKAGDVAVNKSIETPCSDGLTTGEDSNKTLIQSLETYLSKLFIEHFTVLREDIYNKINKEVATIESRLINIEKVIQESFNSKQLRDVASCDDSDSNRDDLALPVIDARANHIIEGTKAQAVTAHESRDTPKIPTKYSHIIKRRKQTTETTDLTAPSRTSRNSNHHHNTSKGADVENSRAGSSNAAYTNTRSKDDNVTKTDKDEWIEVKRGKGRASVPGVLRGTAAPGATALCASERWRHLHLYYVQEGTTVEQVRAHLSSLCGSDACTVEELKSRGRYTSFKLGVPSKYAEVVMSATSWAQDICVKPWRQNFRTKERRT